MNAGRCCELHGAIEERAIPSDGPQISSVRRRFVNGSGWLIPAAILAIVPKCPACLVVYVAMATGFGISISMAAYARVLIVTLCVAMLTYLAVKHVRRAAYLKPHGGNLFGRFLSG